MTCNQIMTNYYLHWAFNPVLLYLRIKNYMHFFSFLKRFHIIGDVYEILDHIKYATKQTKDLESEAGLVIKIL